MAKIELQGNCLFCKYVDIMPSRQKLGILLENKMFEN